MFFDVYPLQADGVPMLWRLPFVTNTVLFESWTKKMPLV